MRRPHDMRQTSAPWIAGLALIGLVLGAAPAQGADEESSAKEGSTEESEPRSSEFRRLMKRGRSAYNDKQWPKAIRHYRDAAQTTPDRAIVYRNLARSYFQNGDYARATTYYDHYLNLAADSAETGQIRRERKLAAHRAGDKVWTLPDAQKRVLEALRKELSDGAAYTEGGGGAWALYKALLRAGYVHPDLAHLQERLRGRLLEEFDAKLETASDQPTPVLSLEQWQRQQRRLEAARTLASNSEIRRRIERRMPVADCGIALLNGRYDDLLERVGPASKANPEMTLLRWYEIVALVHTEKYERAKERIEAARSALGNEASASDRAYLRVMEAIVDQRQKDPRSAAESYIDVLE